MTIKTRILGTFFGMSMLVTLVGVLAVNRQRAAAIVGATKEAQDVASLLSFLLMSDEHRLSAPSVQEIVTRLHQTQGRDVVLMDAHQLVLADAVPSKIGTIFSEDPHDEAGATIKDRQVRTYIEVSPAYPAGIRQIVVPVEDEAGQVIGAVVLEYTPLYNELMDLTRGTIHELAWAGAGSIAVALCLAFYMSRSIARPLQQLTTVATEFAFGARHLAMPPPRPDEIGELVSAFRQMVEKRQRAEDALRRLHDALEERVAVRTAELAQTNEALRAENTERQLAEETLRASNEKFHALADNITDVFWIRSPDMQQLQYVSPAYERVWGHPVENQYAHPQHWAEAILAADRERVLAVFATLMESTPKVDVEYRIARPDGGIRWIRVRGFQVRDKEQTLVRLIGIVTDITEHKKIEEALRESEQCFSGAFEHAPIGVALVSPDGSLLKVNRAFCDLLGYSEAELISSTFQELTYSGDIAGSLENVRRLRAGEISSFQMEKSYVHARGDIVLAQTSVSLVRDGQGQPLYHIAQVQDITERKRAEQAGERALQRLNDAQRIGQIGDWEWNLETQAATWSAQVFEIFGRDLHLGTPQDPQEMGALYDAASWALLQEHAAEAIVSGEPQTIGFVVLRPDGKRIHVRSVAVPKKDAKGRVVGLYGTIQDISAHKVADEALRVSEERLRAALLAANTGTFRWDIRLNTLIWDEALDTLFGLPPGETIQSLETFIATVHPDDRAGVTERCERCAQEGADFAMEFRVIWPDGSVHWLDDKGKTFSDDAGQPLYMTGACVDITERKEAEAELRSKTAFLEAQLNSSLDGIIVVGEGGRKVLQNRRTADLFKIPAAIADGHDDAAQIKWVTNSVKDPTQFVERITFLYSNPQAISRDEIELKDGTTLDRYSAPVIGTDGKFYGRIWTFRDVTARKRADHELVQSQKALEQLNADLERRVAQRTQALLAATAEAERANGAKSDFLSRMSHELRTPMNAILGFAQVLEMEEGFNADQRDCVHHILKGGNHLLVLINEVLDISSIDAGKMTISTEPVSLKDIVEASAGLLQPLAAERNIRLLVMPEEAEPQHVLADRQRLKQVLLNLLANAIKYNRPGGDVMIRWAAAAGSDGAAIRLSIADSGPGISEDKLARLFSPFDRLGAEQTRVEGTGLGLMLAKRMVEYMGGMIGVVSAVGEGSTFWVELHQAEAPAEGRVERICESIPVVVPESSGMRYSLLYVEDNPANVRLITRILARRPAIRMICAETGALGLQLAREHHPDLILLDLHLPDTHGDEVFAQLRSDPDTAQIPVIMLTADAQPGKRDQLVAAGVRAFLTKPVVVRSFLSVIDQFIDPGADDSAAPVR